MSKRGSRDKTVLSHFSHPLRGTATALYMCKRLRTLLNASAQTTRNTVEGTEDVHGKTLFVSRLEDPLHCQFKPCLQFVDNAQLFNTKHNAIHPLLCKYTCTPSAGCPLWAAKVKEKKKGQRKSFPARIRASESNRVMWHSYSGVY